MTGREAAWRVLAVELLASTVETKGSGERPAGYLLSPLGARMNRVLVSGVLGRSEAIGKDPAQPFFRARLEDPTGPVTVTAGGFQPRALAALRDGAPSRPSLVVGKTHLFVGRDGTAYPSIRAESIRALDPDDYRRHLVSAVRQTLERIDLVDALRSVTSGGLALTPDRWPTTLVRSAQEAAGRYPATDLALFREALTTTLGAIESPLLGAPLSSDAARGEVVVTRAVPATRVSQAPTASEREEEAAFLDVVDELSEHAIDGYADLKDTYHRLSERGINEEAAERVLNRLEESGALEEPVVGKLRRA